MAHERAADERATRLRGAWVIWGIPLALSLCGLLMISSLSLRNSMAGGNPYALPLKQFQFLGLGLTLMTACALVPPEALRRHGGKLWLLALLLLLATLVPGVGVRVGGARRWLRLFVFRFQPLEFLLLAAPVFLADRLAASQREGLQVFMRPTLTVTFLSVLPLLFQPNLGGTILVTAVCFLMHSENRGWRYPCLGGLLAVAVFSILIWLEPYRMRRWWAFLDPWSDPMNKGFQIIQGLVAFANGGLAGVGIGRGLQEEQYLPAAQTDYIFSAIGEEFGLMGTLGLLGLYAVWTFHIYRLYRRTEDPFLTTLIFGLAASVICPMFINLGGVMQLMPLTGIPLPFVSSGGSAMLSMWMKVGLLMSINREVAVGRPHGRHHGRIHRAAA